jgi:hypothetical protein
VAVTTVKRLRRTGKAMGEVYQCWWRICREINVFSRFEYHMFYFLYSFTDSPPYIHTLGYESATNLSLLMLFMEILVVLRNIRNHKHSMVGKARKVLMLKLVVPT